MEKKKVILLCDLCFARNYTFLKSANSSSKLEVKKYCPKCNKHTLHKETR